MKNERTEAEVHFIKCHPKVSGKRLVQMSIRVGRAVGVEYIPKIIECDLNWVLGDETLKYILRLIRL